MGTADAKGRSIWKQVKEEGKIEKMEGEERKNKKNT
jgi:hypothetical protein